MEKRKDTISFKRLLSYLKPHRKDFIISLLLMTIVVVIDLIPTIFMGLVLDSVSKMNDVSEIRPIILYLVIFFGSFILAVFINFKQSLILQHIGQKIVLEIRLEVFSHIENLSIEQLNKRPVGSMVTRVMNDPESISQMFTSVIINLIRSFIMMVIILILLFIISPKLTIISLVTMPIIGIVSYIFRKVSRKTYRSIKDEVSRLNSFLSENLSGMKITQIFNREDQKREEFKIRSRNLEKSYQKEILIYAIFRPAIYLITMLGTIAVLYFGGLEVILTTSILTFGILYSFNDLVDKFYQPIQQIAEEFNNLQDAFSSSDKIFDVLDRESVVQDSVNAIDLKEFKGNIEFKNVWFSYIENEWVLKDVSFTVSPGETVAFVGATGSGKTTILSLIVRNYDIQKGQILIDGIDIKNITRNSIRKHIGQMLQDVFLFNDTIERNISLGDESITMDEVVKASEYVGANYFIERLNGGYNHLVLERGNNFSSGQRQLISFARAICYKPSLLILDEATSNIDSESEQLIQESLKKIMKEQTMLIVAHRLSTIQHSDKIIVLHKGEIVEEGNHQELLKNKNMYYNLYMIQYEERD